MKTRWLSSIVFLFLLGALLLTTGGAQAQNPQPYGIEGGGGPGPVSSAFTYQGMLKVGGTPYTGVCNFIFTLWDSSGSGTPPTGGSQIGNPDVLVNVAVSNGLFNVVLNASGNFNPKDSINYYAFNGDGRWLQIWVQCPPGTGSADTLSPRQPLWAVPYAISLMPGAHIVGSDYQNLKVVNETTVTGNPAGVTGEITASTDGVGVYGGNTVVSTGATGMGVWGRTKSPEGAGVKGTGFNGTSAIGVYAEGSGTDTSHPALLAVNTNANPGGIAIFGKGTGWGGAIVAQNVGTTGNYDLYRGLDKTNTVVFQVTYDGHVYSSGLSTSRGADVAEQFAVSSTATPEPGTLMVIDPDHPGQLKPSSSAYDSKVAGVVSGAGGLQPGVTLSEQDGVAIALAGRVYVKAEALSQAIVPGDLLTSSDLPGYAMKASDRSRAAGTVIGKAMTGLESGTGLVLVLVSLQ